MHTPFCDAVGVDLPGSSAPLVPSLHVGRKRFTRSRVDSGAMNTAVPVIALDHPAAFDVARVGRKAAALAQARAAGLPVGSGVVLTTQWSREDRATVDQVWRIISHDGARPLVVRPSAVARDRCRPAGAGALEAMQVVGTAAELIVAIDEIRHGDDRTETNVPVLVHPHLAGAWRGVLFDDDGNGGRRRRRAIVVAVDGDPDTTWIAELDHAGRIRDVLSGHHLDHPPIEVLVRLVRLAERVAAAFDGPHDIEWTSDDAGRVHLLRVRPVVRLRAAPTTEPVRPVFLLADDESAA